MNEPVDPLRLYDAYETVRGELLAEQTADGHWVGKLASSPLATATAISALVMAHRGDSSKVLRSFELNDRLYDGERIVQSDLSELIIDSLHWLARHQNEDGGWGDTDRGDSTLASTMLVRAAFQLTGVPAKYADLMVRADQFISSQGGPLGLRRRYGKDKTFAAPILANSALAGLLPWRQVPALPFEMACLPQSWYRFLRLPVVSYAIPALVAIGQAKFTHDPPRNPFKRLWQRWARPGSLAVVEKIQPTNGGFLEAVPLTAFVVMNLASIGHQDHPVVQQGVEFLLASVRADMSWPIDTNLAIWNTTLAMDALSTGPEPQQASAEEEASLYARKEISAQFGGCSEPVPHQEACLDWLLDCQQTEPHPFTGAPAGGWAWTDQPGGVPDADDTAGVLLVLAGLRRPPRRTRQEGGRWERVERAAHEGVGWLLGLQNRDGGWPTFCRGWGLLPFDRSACDLTAHALRALDAWRKLWKNGGSEEEAELDARMASAIDRGLLFLESQQREDGSWVPLWFGNPHHETEENPVYGSSQVLRMLAQLEQTESAMARRAVDWLVLAQHTNGGWGPPATSAIPKTTKPPAALPDLCTVEETSLAIIALLPWVEVDASCEQSVHAGLAWLLDAISEGRHLKPAPLGFYFAKLWYYERLYPRVFATSALARAVKQFSIPRSRVPAAAARS